MLDQVLKADSEQPAPCHDYSGRRLYLTHEKIHIGVNFHALKFFWGSSDLHQETAIRNIHLNFKYAFFVFVSEFEDFAVHDIVIIIQKTPLSLFSGQVLQAYLGFVVCHTGLCASAIVIAAHAN